MSLGPSRAGVGRDSTTDRGQTGSLEEAKNRGLTFAGLRIAKKESTSNRLLRRSRQHHETRIAKNTKQKMGRARTLTNPRTPSKAERDRHVVSHIPFRDWCRHCVAGRGAERWHQKHPAHADEHPLVCTDCGSLSGDAAPILVAKDRRTGTISALLVERNGAADPRAVEKLAEWVDARGPPQVITRSDGDPAVMLVAAAVRDASRTEARTTLETSTNRLFWEVASQQLMQMTGFNKGPKHPCWVTQTLCDVQSSQM